jgi:hypothetical protein
MDWATIFEIVGHDFFLFQWYPVSKTYKWLSNLKSFIHYIKYIYIMLYIYYIIYYIYIILYILCYIYYIYSIYYIIYYIICIHTHDYH